MTQEQLASSYADGGVERRRSDARTFSARGTATRPPVLERVNIGREKSIKISLQEIALLLLLLLRRWRRCRRCLMTKTPVVATCAVKVLVECVAAGARTAMRVGGYVRVIPRKYKRNQQANDSNQRPKSACK